MSNDQLSMGPTDSLLDATSPFTKYTNNDDSTDQFLRLIDEINDDIKKHEKNSNIRKYLENFDDELNDFDPNRNPPLQCNQIWNQPPPVPPTHSNLVINPKSLSNKSEIETISPVDQSKELDSSNENSKSNTVTTELPAKENLFQSTVKQRCKFCKRYFINFKNHTEYCAGQVEPIVNCHVCNEKLLHAQIASHIQLRHKPFGNSTHMHIKCEACHRFMIKYFFLKHLNNNHITKDNINAIDDISSMILEQNNENSSMSSTQCKFCQANFESTDLLKDHESKHEIKSVVQCKVCQIFLFQDDFFKHFQSLHKSESLNKKTSIDQLSESLPYQIYVKCTQCNAYMSSKVTLREHHELHEQKLINSRIKPNLDCEDCEKKFTKFSHYQRHRRCRHLDTTNATICIICKHWIRHEFLNSHMSWHNGTRPSFDCKHCEKKFEFKHILQSHIKHKHSKEDLKCKLCDKSFKFRNSLMLHETKHDSVRKFTCHVCGKSYKTKSMLNCHLVVHKNLRNFRCKTCSKTFNCRAYLRAHESIHDPPEVKES